jgi:tRNA threonylcarbamoyladenosine biosynthesis protein TsaB
MPLILQIETATQTCAVALAQNGEVIAFKEQTDRNIHASQITLFIEEVLKQGNKTYQDLDAIAVSKGPGSYTGLRIGVSSAKGLCFALDIPLIAVDTLAAMAKGFIERCFSVNPNALFCPMIDARRMEVYTAVYDANMNYLQETSAKIIDEGSFENELAAHIVYFFGDGAQKCESILGLNPNARVLADEQNSAKDLSSLALEKFNNKDFEDVAYFEPLYLKDFVVQSKKAK